MRDATATHLTDSAGGRRESGASQNEETRATLTAAIASLSFALSDLAGTYPLLIRTEEHHLHDIAGMSRLPRDCEHLGRELRSLWIQARQDRSVWLAGWRRGRLYWWGDRAASLADQCASGSWGPQPPRWTPHPTLAALRGATPDTAQCSICLEDFVDPLPRPRQARARSSDVFHGCPTAHAACVACDKDLALMPQPRCATCRRPRAPWATLA